MNAGIGGIGPVSVRYAAQIRELLFTQAIQRLAADEEAARAADDVKKTSRADAREDAREPVKVDIDTPLPEPRAPASTAAHAPPSAAPAQIVDIQA